VLPTCSGKHGHAILALRAQVGFATCGPRVLERARLTCLSKRMPAMPSRSAAAAEPAAVGNAARGAAQRLHDLCDGCESELSILRQGRLSKEAGRPQVHLPAGHALVTAISRLIILFSFVAISFLLLFILLFFTNSQRAHCSI